MTEQEILNRQQQNGNQSFYLMLIPPCRRHARRLYGQHFAKGVLFVGGMVKPGRKYISRRNKGRLFSKIHYYNDLLSDPGRVTPAAVEGMVATMNSYLGMMCHYNELTLFRRVLQRVSPQWYRHVWFSRRGRHVKAVQRVDY